MEKFTVPVRDDVSPDNQASFDALKKSLGMVPNLYAAIAYSDNGPHRYLILLTEGQVRLHADLTEYEVVAGSILLFSPYQPFMFREAENIAGTVIHFHELLISYLKIFLIKASRLKIGTTMQHTGHRPQAAIAQQLRDAIEENYRTMHTPGEYAALLHVTPKVLATAAKTHFSKTLTGLISERIIIEAKRELYLSSKR